MKLRKQEKHLIDVVASSMQTGGLPKAAGRIVGYLMICERGYVSFDEIMQDLGLSKGSVSQSLNLLQTAGFVEATKDAGVRKRYYHLCTPAHGQFLESRIRGIRQTHDVLQQVKRINRAAGRKNQRQAIDDILRFNAFMEKELIKKGRKTYRR